MTYKIDFFGTPFVISRSSSGMKWNENRITRLRSKTMKSADRIIAAGGITAVVGGIGAELYLFLQWILQQPDLYRWPVQLY